ncbi:MAG TPA: energy transducer TonB [Spirochaetia bacterium]|nr:energy transducer TonB [Spirochaetales bacterium]HRY79407.1 energy transducer TonB [Spirochaetia bacterium]
MSENAESEAGRHLLEPLGQVGSLMGEIPEPEIAFPGRSGPRDSRGRLRLDVCLAVSLALHALVLALFPVPGTGGRGAAASTVRVNLILGTGAAAREAAGSVPSGEGAAPAAPSPGAPDGSASDAPEDSLPRPGEAEPAGGEEPGAPDSAVSPSAPGAPAAGSAAGSGGAGYPSPSDRAAALLLARVEAALVYPEAARRRGTEGVVGLRILLDGSGALADLKITRSSGSSLLDKAARETVAACLPVPNPSGIPLAFELAVRFTLKKAAAP